MPIGKDSIQKRVAKTVEVKENIAPELVATTAAAPAPKKPAPKKTAAKSTAQTKSTKATATKKSPASTKEAPKATKKAVEKPAEAKRVETTVLANVAPETVAAVIGHKEGEKQDKVSIGGKLPVHLL